MDFFKHLGDSVEHARRRVGYDEGRFPEIAERALLERPPSGCLGTYDTLTWFVKSTAAPTQIHLTAPFGQPPVQVYHTSRFYIEVLYWIDGTTSIHEHAFNGAFHVLAGSSIHCKYQFHERRRYNLRLKLGRIELEHVELLKKGDTRRILPARAMSHSLFHLDRPSVTVVIRTPEIPGSAPQYTYLRPGIAIDSFYKNAFVQRQLQAFDTLAKLEHPELEALLAHAYCEADPFALAQLVLASPTHLKTVERVRAVVSTARKPDGDELIDALLDAVLENSRQSRIESSHCAAGSAQSNIGSSWLSCLTLPQGKRSWRS